MAYRFDQDEDHLLYSGGAPSGDFTAEFWVRFNSLTSTYISLLWIGSDDVYSGAIYRRGVLFVTGTDPATVEIWARDDTTPRIISSSLSTGTDYHFALTGNTANSQAIALYINGVQDGTGTTGNLGTYEAAQVMVGNDRQLDAFDPDTNFSTGYMSRVVVCNRQKSVEEIRAGMFDFLTAAQESWGAWFIEDANGLIDVSGNGRDLTSQGTPTVDNTTTFPGAYDGFYGWGGWNTAAAAGGSPVGSLIAGKLLRGGLLMHGVLGR